MTGVHRAFVFLDGISPELPAEAFALNDCKAGIDSTAHQCLGGLGGLGGLGRKNLPMHHKDPQSNQFGCYIDAHIVFETYGAKQLSGGSYTRHRETCTP